jgi:hypothetical protein
MSIYIAILVAILVAISVAIPVAFTVGITVSISVTNLRGKEPWSTSSNRAWLDDSSAPRIKIFREELGKRTGVDGFSKSIKHRCTFVAGVRDLRDNKPWLAPFNRARFDDSNVPGIKTIEE